MGLSEYQRKRDFKATPEPAEGGDKGKKTFVVQLHHASHRHFDFRLELDGVLKSWAVPKGPSFDPSVKRLAMEVEDHPISYAAFEGDIPKGNYGAGHVDVFDSGTWEPIGSAHQGLGKGDLKFILYGDVLRGSWVLVRTRKQGAKNQWLLIKHQDEYAGPRDANAFVDPKTDRPISRAKRKLVWKGSPAKDKKTSSKKAAAISDAPDLARAKSETIANEGFNPELCRVRDEPPAGDEWLHEVKWDGYRIVATVVKGKVKLWSRNAIEWTHKVPELAEAIASLKLRSAQLDGEMIVLRDGRDSFNALQSRLSAQTKEPAVYMLFDMPHLNGKSLRNVPLIDRKAALAELLREHPHPLLRYSEHQVGDGKAMFAQATAAGFEGIVSKRAQSTYQGSRNGDWIKVKGRPSDEFIVIGYTEPKGARSGIGALLLAKPNGNQLVYVGRVGTGFNDEQLRALRKELAKTVIDKTSVDIDLMERRDRSLAIWVRPKKIVEVFYQGVGGQGLLRQPAFKAFRDDKSLSDLRGDAAKSERSIKRAKRQTAAAESAAAKTRAPSKTKALKKNGAADASTDNVAITHPERVVFPELGVTKADVAAYYRAVAPWIMSEIGGRPLSVVRCPDGAGKACFFQKHELPGWGPHIFGVDVKTERKKYLRIDEAAGLLELVQMNVLEIHPWGARAADPDHADRIVFDLDPHPDVRWPRVIAAAAEMKKQLARAGLTSFLRTSGGKGFHVVVPLSPPAPWEDVKAFAQAVAEAMAGYKPKEFVAIAGEKNRVGKIFVDWLRNGRGATSVASFSLRARQTAGVAMPLAWSELPKIKRGDAFTIQNAIGHIRKWKTNPWSQIDEVRQTLPTLG